MAEDGSKSDESKSPGPIPTQSPAKSDDHSTPMKNADDRRRARRHGMKRKPPSAPISDPLPKPQSRPFRTFILWLGGVVSAAVVGGVVAVWLDKKYEPRLEVVHIPGVHMDLKLIETARRGNARVDVFEARPEFKNHGWREGSIAHCAVEPWRSYISPKVEITHIDTRPISAGETQSRNVQFRTILPADPRTPYEVTLSIGCWDSTGNRTGTLYALWYPHGEKRNPPTP